MEESKRLYRTYKGIGIVFFTLIGLCEFTEQRYTQEWTLRNYAKDWTRVAFISAIIGYMVAIGYYKLCHFICLVLDKLADVITFRFGTREDREDLDAKIDHLSKSLLQEV